jgi:hypothetical protein
MGLISCGRVDEIEPDFPFLFLNDPGVDGAREIFWVFQFELKGVSGTFSRSLGIEDIEAMRCSLAFREAFVSRANLGTNNRCWYGGGGLTATGICCVALSGFDGAG